jgi:hypothetical protein
MKTTTKLTANSGKRLRVRHCRGGVSVATRVRGGVIKGNNGQDKEG